MQTHQMTTNDKIRCQARGTARIKASPLATRIEELSPVFQDFHGARNPAVERFLDEQVLPSYRQTARETMTTLDDALYQLSLYALKAEALAYSAYLSAGKETFEFTPELVQELRQSDLGDVRLGYLALPYPAFYLFFGRQADIVVDDHQRYEAEFFDGAFVWQEPGGSLHFSFTLSREGKPSSGLAGPAFSIDAGLLELPADIAIQRGFALSVAQIKALQDKLLQQGEDAEEVMDQHLRYIGAINDAASLVVNALFFLSAYGLNLAQEPSSGTPPRLVAALASARNPKARRNAKNAILKNGHSLVRMCGANWQRHPPARTSDTKDSAVREFRTHWRRGHWRQQKYGAGLEKIRVIWIRPCLVEGTSTRHMDESTYLVSA